MDIFRRKFPNFLCNFFLSMNIPVLIDSFLASLCHTCIYNDPYQALPLNPNSNSPSTGDVKVPVFRSNVFPILIKNLSNVTYSPILCVVCVSMVIAVNITDSEKFPKSVCDDWSRAARDFNQCF